MSYIIKGKTGDWKVVIGLEVHCQIKTKSKLFSRSSTEFGAEANKHVSFYDCAMPGQLPVINKYSVEQTIKTGLGLNAEFNMISRFDRKNYFYADLPSGYQITQFFSPIIKSGWLNIKLENGDDKKIRIHEAHIEHTTIPQQRSSMSRICIRRQAKRLSSHLAYLSPHIPRFR